MLNLTTVGVFGVIVAYSIHAQYSLYHGVKLAEMLSRYRSTYKQLNGYLLQSSPVLAIALLLLYIGTLYFYIAAPSDPLFFNALCLTIIAANLQVFVIGIFQLWLIKKITKKNPGFTHVVDLVMYLTFIMVAVVKFIQHT